MEEDGADGGGPTATTDGGGCRRECRPRRRGRQRTEVAAAPGAGRAWTDAQQRGRRSLGHRQCPGPVPDEGDSNGGGPGAQELHKGALVIAQSGRNGADDYRRERPRLQVETARTTGDDDHDFRWRRRRLQAETATNAGEGSDDYGKRQRRLQAETATNAGEGSDDYRGRQRRPQEETAVTTGGDGNDYRR